MALFSASIVAGLLLGWLRRGSLDAMGRRTVRLLWLVPLALAVDYFIGYAAGLDVPAWVWPLHVASYGVLLAVVLANRHLAGMPLLGLGLLLNATVIALNGGLMPEAPQTLDVKHRGEPIAIGQHPRRTKDVVLPHDQARLWWLGDVIASPPGFPVQTVLSAGDVVVAAGLGWTVMGLMRRNREEELVWHSISNLPS